MPTIASTPVQIPPDGKWTQFTNQKNPFYVEIGSSLYTVLFSAQGTSPAAKIGVFRRAAADVGGAWAEQDASHSPAQGSQSGIGCVSVKGTVISVAYLQTGATVLAICTYDTATDTWGTASATFTLPQAVSRFAFVQRSDNVYVVLAATIFRIYYVTYSGTWGTRTDLLPSGGNVVDAVIDSTDQTHVLLNIQVSGGGNGITYWRLSPAYSLGGVWPVANSILPMEGGWPSLILADSNTVAIAYIPTSGPGVNTARVLFGTPLSAPVFTDSQVYSPAAGETMRFIELAVGTGGDLNVFLVTANPTLPTNQVIQGVWDGSAWSASIFYDAIANPPIDGAASQTIRTLQGIQLSGGWSVVTSLTINDMPNPPATFISAEMLESGSPAPPPPPPTGPGIITCQIIIVGPPPPPHGEGTPKTLRYQIPQRRWFPHTYND